MKKLIALLALLPAVFSAMGQAITITAADMPAPTASYNVLDWSLDSASNPVAGPSVGWDYSSHIGIGVSVPYIPETDTFFTHSGATVNYPATKSLIPHYGYHINKELSFTSTDAQVAGIGIPFQGFSLTSLTGGTNDSLVFPSQKYILTTPVDLVHFPFTAGSSWRSTSRCGVNFQVTDSFYLLNHMPGQHVFYIHRNDTIEGYGKLRVHTAMGPSMPYDVLMDKSIEYTSDSFFLGGAPANPIFLSTFGIAQGQGIDSSCKYLFYRKTSFCYLMMMDYGADKTFTNAASKYSDTENVVPASVGVPGLAAQSFATVVYPMPVRGNDLHVLISGKQVSGGYYNLLDQTGRICAAGAAEKMPGGLTVKIGTALNNGTYILELMDERGAKLVEEQVVVAR